MFVCERTLLVCVTLNTWGIPASRQPGLFKLKTAVRVMTITAAHGAFQNFVMERRRECRLDFAVATQAKLRVVHLQHSYAGEARLFGIRSRHVDIRTGEISSARVGMGRMALSAADIVAPVLTASEIVVLFFPRVA